MANFFPQCARARAVQRIRVVNIALKSSMVFGGHSPRIICGGAPGFASTTYSLSAARNTIAPSVSCFALRVARRAVTSSEADPLATLNVAASTTIPWLFERLPICSSCTEPSARLYAIAATTPAVNPIMSTLLVDIGMALLLPVPGASVPLGWKRISTP